MLIEERRGSPRFLGRPCRTRREPNTTPGVLCSNPHFMSRAPWPSRAGTPWAPRKTSVFEADSPRLARSHTYASPDLSPVSVARFAPEWPGSALSDGFRNPLDDEPNFRRLTHASSFWTRLAWPPPQLGRCRSSAAYRGVGCPWTGGCAIGPRRQGPDSASCRRRLGSATIARATRSA